MPSIEIHVAASPTRRFASMLYFLVRSLEERAGLGGDWRVVVTLGRDGKVDPGTRPFGWARGMPVEFRRPDEALCARFEAEAERRGRKEWRYFATVLTQFLHAPQADLVMFMDADTVVARPFGDVLEAVAARGGIAAKPAWQPPGDIDLSETLASFGLAYDGPPMEYSGWGWSFQEPRFGPPYFNGGFQVFAREDAAAQARDMPAVFEEVAAREDVNRYLWQIAQSVVIVRNEMAWLALDERFNMGVGEGGPPLLGGEAGAALARAGDEMVRDARVLHYCTPGPSFVRNAVMGDPERMEAFLGSGELTDGERALRDAFAPYAEGWREWLGPREAPRVSPRAP